MCGSYQKVAYIWRWVTWDVVYKHLGFLLSVFKLGKKWSIKYAKYILITWSHFSALLKHLQDINYSAEIGLFPSFTFLEMTSEIPRHAADVGIASRTLKSPCFNVLQLQIHRIKDWNEGCQGLGEEGSGKLGINFQLIKMGKF